jgi:quinol monooxygenase YgiN
MITRIVKLHIDENKVADFIAIYESSKSFIQNSSGNISVKLVKDIHQENILFTISEWNCEEYLNNYRNTEFFAKVWSQVKTLLISKTDAWSLEEIINH